MLEVVCTRLKYSESVLLSLGAFCVGLAYNKLAHEAPENLWLLTDCIIKKQY